MRWLGGVAVATAWIAASLPAAAQGQPAGGAPASPLVIVHFDAHRDGVRLYELNPGGPLLHRVTPLCDSPCQRFVTPLWRTYFYDGEGIARSVSFKIPTRYPDVTIHAEPRSDAMRSAGVGTILGGALTFAAGAFLIGFGISDGVDGIVSLDTEQKLVFGGVAAIVLGAIAVGVGAGLVHEGKSSVRVDAGKPVAASLRLGPGGPALVF